MPADIVTGDDARDVAAYVAQAAAVPGEDTGRLAAVGAKKAEGTAEAENGVAGHPDGRRPARRSSSPTPRPRPARSRSRPRTRRASPHNIAVRGNGVDEKGPVVSTGTSEVTVDLQPGEYEFYCSVPGHGEGGMKGKLIVE